MLGKLGELIVGREPVMFASVVSAVLGLVVAFGLDLSDEQQAALDVAIVTVLGFAARAVVTPTRKLEP